MIVNGDLALADSLYRARPPTTLEVRTLPSSASSPPSSFPHPPSSFPHHPSSASSPAPGSSSAPVSYSSPTNTPPSTAASP
ncbi:uncharacterized protein BDZ99DRAFT_466358 [Mytilinidion resinicola]|uniref:Uncharacterized protein n=1 Tax=Mytilinidion resinicola TaxID=574789 RepID=A0A6A6YBK0_9PEZI|nr:uncharacterized protein BDZ99DRAFT_466358 [Mytilinidion resinicola]KAF2806070.1 hypothetical protein BDZ99DRAFT_466358 [Mytilinidion resinicola]